MKKKIDHQSILYSNSLLRNLNFGEKEGERLIDISTRSNSMLGRLLSPRHTSNTRLFCGKVAKLKSFMQAIKTPGYPIELLSKSVLSESEAKSIPREVKSLPNFWALVAYAVVERIRQDKALIEMLKANTLEFTCLEAPKEKELHGAKIVYSSVSKRMGAYVAIIRNIELMIKEGTFDNKEVVDKFIQDCREDKTKTIFENIQLPVNIVTE